MISLISRSLAVMLICVSPLLKGQGSWKGRVLSLDGPVPFATVGLPQIKRGIIAGTDGNFIINDLPAGHYRVVITAVGYRELQFELSIRDKQDLVRDITLEAAQTGLNTVVVSGTQREVLRTESIVPVEVYTSAFLRKNPSPSLFESLSMVNGVQPQINCNVCHTGDIHINGMEGPYTMVLIDGMPIVSSLSTVYGLSAIPPGLIKRIEVVKGPASTQYGSEAMAGIINVITKDPESIPAISGDISGTNPGGWQADLSLRALPRKGAFMAGFHGYSQNQIRDRNEDGFTDFPIQNRVSFFSRYTRSVLGWNTSTALRLFKEDRWGGQTGYTKQFRGTDSIYGESIETRRMEVIGSLAKDSRGHVVEYSYNLHEQNSYYGLVHFTAIQHTAFLQARTEKKWHRHHLSSGIPLRWTWYDDNTPATGGPLKNHPSAVFIPGVYFQDEYKAGIKTRLLGGVRLDQQSNHGFILTPRVGIRYEPVKNHALRFSLGKGFRTVNIFTEDHAALTGARRVEIQNKLRPEICWNGTLNYTGMYSLRKGYIALDVSLFNTRFSNKIIADYDSDPSKIIYDNLHGHAVSRGLSMNVETGTTSSFSLHAGITLLDVFRVEDPAGGMKQKTRQQFTPGFSGTYGLSYEIPLLRLGLDLTGKVNSPMLLPVVPNDFRPSESPWFSIHNIQIRQKYDNGLEVYLSVKNLLDFVPAHPILRPFDPFNKHVTENNPNGYTFDTSYNYAPLQGRTYQAGIRFSLNAFPRAVNRLKKAETNP